MDNSFAPLYVPEVDFYSDVSWDADPNYENDIMSIKFIILSNTLKYIITKYM